MNVSTRRIVVLGKTGAGKSSVANTICGKTVFEVDHSPKSGTRQCRAETTCINGRRYMWIDTPGIFDTKRPEEELKTEIVRCITECAPGPHVFLIVLKVEKFTEQEQAVITKMCEYFTEDALKYAAVVFTHGEQLQEGMKIEEYVDQSEGLSDLVKKCGGRCHVFDNKYWKNNQEDEYRSNCFQVAELLNTIDRTVMENNEGYYTDEMLQEVERAIQEEEERIRKSSGNMSQEEVRRRAKSAAFKKQVDNAPRTWIRYLVGFTVKAGILAIVLIVLIRLKYVKVLREAPPDKEITATTVAGQKIAETVSTIGQVVEDAIQKTFEVVLNKLNALYELTYDP